MLKWLRNKKKKQTEEPVGAEWLKRKEEKGRMGGHLLDLIPYLPPCIRFPVRDRLTDRMRSA